jgi:hypothetical protein
VKSGVLSHPSDKDLIGNWGVDYIPKPFIGNQKNLLDFWIFPEFWISETSEF